VRWVEEAVRMDLRLSRYVQRVVRDGGYERVVSLSERVGLPLIHQLPAGVKHVVIVHHAMSQAKLTALRLANAANNWDLMMAVSPSEAKGMENALGLPSGTVAPLLASIDTGFYRPAAEEVPLSERDHIQSIGSSHRDYLTLFRALRTLPHVACEIRLGSTWVRNRVSFKGERIPAGVRIKPFIPPHELREWYGRQRFSVITLQDDTQWSAGCTSVQHAQAMGRAVIASDRPGLHSYMINGETGILVRTGDEKDLAEAIDFLWRNPEKADAMGRRGRQFVAATFSIDVWLERITGLIEDATQTRHVASMVESGYQASLEG
jgi:glycosyltransferase involved in cell wall biosynthesis